MAGRFCILAAALLWSTGGLFAKAPLFDDWPADLRGPALAFWRALFGGLVVLPAVRRPRMHVRLFPMTALFAAMSYCYLTSLTRTTAANAIWLQSTAPVWVFLWGWLVRRERVERGGLLLLITGAAGVGTILGFELAWAAARNASALGVSLGLAAGVFYAGVIRSLHGLRGEDAAWLVAVNLWVTAALLSPFAAAQSVRPSGLQLGVLAAFGVFQIGLPYLLFARGLKTVPSQEGAGIALLEPCLVPVWVWLAWREVPRVWTVAGAGLILAGLAARYAAVRGGGGRGG